MKSYVVTVYIFSGRENPQWTLTSKQKEKWNEYWSEAAIMRGVIKPGSRLGYNGCRVQDKKHSYWFIHNGGVSFYSDKQALTKKDAERKMEIFLLQTADEKTKQMLAEMNVL